MIHFLDFKKERIACGFIKAFRKNCAVFLVLIFFGLAGAPKASAEMSIRTLYKAHKYKELISVIEGRKLKDDEKLPYKDYAFLIKAYEQRGDVNGRLRSIQRAVRDHPQKDIFKREEAVALEEKSNSYVDTKPYKKMKAKLKLEASKILNDLYTSRPTKENFTALVSFYNREKNYDEAIGLLELYARENLKGRIYYTYLCEAQYQAKMYETARETCGALKQKYPGSEKAHIFYGMSLKKTGEGKEAAKNFVRVASRFPASSSIQYEAGKALIEEGKREKGLRHLETHLKLETTDDALLLRASTLFSLKEYDKALEAFIKACKVRKKRKAPLLNEFRKAASSLTRKSEDRLRYDKEIKRCKYVYGAKKKMPRGLLGGGRYTD